MSQPQILAAKQLICPLCESTLNRSHKTFRCQNNHAFDIAKQGYLNLLPVQQKRSKSPGDDKAMVLSRKTFLNEGHYQPLAAKVSQLLLEHTEQKALTVLDAGSGEGYYTEQLLNHANNSANISSCALYGIDISKPAVIEASKRTKSIAWLVASLKNIPLRDNSLDGILSVFSPIQASTFQEKLKPSGFLLVVTPGNHHLDSLKQALYDEVKSFNEDKTVALLEDDWNLVHKEKLQYAFTVNSTQLIQDLLSMTPHTWRISPEKKARLEQINELSCEADFLITLWQKKP